MTFNKNYYHLFFSTFFCFMFKTIIFKKVCEKPSMVKKKKSKESLIFWFSILTFYFQISNSLFFLVLEVWWLLCIHFSKRNSNLWARPQRKNCPIKFWNFKINLHKTRFQSLCLNIKQTGFVLCLLTKTTCWLSLTCHSGSQDGYAGWNNQHNPSCIWLRVWTQNLVIASPLP